MSKRLASTSSQTKICKLEFNEKKVVELISISKNCSIVLKISFKSEKLTYSKGHYFYFYRKIDVNDDQNIWRCKQRIFNNGEYYKVVDIKRIQG